MSVKNAWWQAMLTCRFRCDFFLISTSILGGEFITRSASAESPVVVLVGESADIIARGR